MKRLKSYLEKYEEGSDHIKVEQKDPVVNPKFTSEYTSDDVATNSLIVVCGDRSKVVNYSSIYESSIDYNTYQSTTTGFDGEGQIDSAISYVTSEDLPVLIHWMDMVKKTWILLFRKISRKQILILNL